MARNVLRDDGVTLEIEKGFANAVDQTNRSIRVTNYNNKLVLIDCDGGTNPVYIGVAEPKTSTSDATWSIKKITWDSNDNPSSIKWADGETLETKVWDNRAGYDYK